MNRRDRDTVALGYTSNGSLVFCSPGDRDVHIIAAGDTYDAVLIQGLRDEFDLDHYDAQAAIAQAAKQMPALRTIARRLADKEGHDVCFCSTSCGCSGYAEGPHHLRRSCTCWCHDNTCGCPLHRGRRETASVETEQQDGGEQP